MKTKKVFTIVYPTCNSSPTLQKLGYSCVIMIKASKLKIRKKSNFVVTFKDANKKPIKKVKVKFKIKGKTYTRTTNSKGQAKLKITLKTGKYSVKVSFKNTKYYGTTTLTKKIRVVK